MKNIKEYSFRELERRFVKIYNAEKLFKSMQMDDINYHIVEEAPEDVEYKKEVQSIEKDKKRKLLGKESKKETKQPHHFQFEKVY